MHGKKRLPIPSWTLGHAWCYSPADVLAAGWSRKVDQGHEKGVAAGALVGKEVRLALKRDKAVARFASLKRLRVRFPHHGVEVDQRLDAVGLEPGEALTELVLRAPLVALGQEVRGVAVDRGGNVLGKGQLRRRDGVRRVELIGQADPGAKFKWRRDERASWWWRKGQRGGRGGGDGSKGRA